KEVIFGRAWPVSSFSRDACRRAGRALPVLGSCGETPAGQEEWKIREHRGERPWWTLGAREREGLFRRVATIRHPAGKTHVWACLCFLHSRLLFPYSVVIGIDARRFPADWPLDPGRASGRSPD